MPKISIIVPVYNVEPYLCRCIDSILSQSFSDFELILVDDGSPDQCPLICDSYAAKDKRITVIHKKNGGVSAARNAGLDIARGRYITFCDSDDLWNPNWLTWLHSKMTETRADIVNGSYCTVNGQNAMLNQCVFPEFFVEFSNDDSFSDYLITNILGYQCGWEIWTRLFKAEIIQGHHIRFCETCANFSEDLGFVLEYLLYTKSAYTGTYVGYRYLVRQESMMQRSKYIIKLNSMNEVSKQFGLRLINDNSPIYKTHYPLVHFLIMHNQYSKLIGEPEYHKLPIELKKIQDKKWFYQQTRRIFKCSKLLNIRYGKGISQRILFFSHLCLHQNWKRFCFESAIFYRWIYKGD